MEITRITLLRSVELDGEIVSILGNNHYVIPTLLKVLRRLHWNLGEEYEVQIEKNKNPDQNENVNVDTSGQSDVDNDIGCDDTDDYCKDVTT